MKNDLIGDEESAINILEEDYEITNIEDDYVLSEDLQNWLNSKKIGKTMTKLGLELHKHASINNFKFVYSKIKKIKGKGKKCWFGIKLIPDLDNDKK
jgi:PDZ domain-containing secreted protein